MSDFIKEELFYLGTLPLLCIIIHYFFYNCLGSSFKKTSHIVLVYVMYTALHFTLHLSSLNSTVNMSLNIVILLIISFFYNKNYLWKIGTVLFICAIMLLSDAMVQSFLCIIVFPNYTTPVYIISLFLSKCIMFVLVYIAKKFCKSFSECNLSAYHWAFILIVPITSYYGFYQFYLYYYMGKSPWFHTIIALLLIFINFIAFILFNYIIQLKIKQNDSILLKQEINYYNHQYLLAKSTRKETLRFRHDIKNILVGLLSELENGNIDECKKLILSHVEDYDISTIHSYCNNLIIDSIIKYKYKIAKSYGIVFDVDLKIPDNIKVDATNMSIILGNALDNAIEACQRVFVKDKIIKCQMHYQNESLFIHIENPYVNSLNKDNDTILSTKKSKFHGFGIDSIRKAVSKSNGIFDVTFTDNVFCLEIVLFCIKRKKQKDIAT
ncbi:GHKL domain-containing protein [Clostridiaceae bacterium M8S5]|nr:GHKL domain-containing protein [Clostridiaceae bacterium M8S5]